MEALCSQCSRHIGGWFRPAAWKCPTCNKVFCGISMSSKDRVRCKVEYPQAGRLLKSPMCPDDHVEMRTL